MIRARGVHRLWRASTLGLAAAVVVIGGAFINLQSAANIERRAADREAIAAELGRSFGREYLTEQLFGADTAKHIMAAAKPGSVGKASVYTNPQWDHAMLYCQSVAAGTGRTLRVVALDKDGKVLEQLAEFESSGELMAVEITLGTIQATQLAIIAAPRGLNASEGELLMRMT